MSRRLLTVMDDQRSKSQSKWKIASTRVLVISFAFLAITQGMYFTYLIASTTTLEKRFAYDGKLTGFVLIADNISQLFIR